MARKKGELSDNDILTKIEEKVKSSIGFTGASKLSAERERVLQYYNSQLPAAPTGTSPYVSTDVYDSVEAMKAQLLETFSGNTNDLISFPAQGDNDIEPARIATEYCSYVVFRQNAALKNFHDTIHNGLMERVGIVKVFWEEKHEYIDEEFMDLDEPTVMQMAADESVEELEGELDPLTNTFKGTLRRKVDYSGVTILPIPGDEFGISKHAACIKDAEIVFHRTLKTKAELKDMGLDEGKVDKLSSDSDMSSEKAQREWMTETSTINDETPLVPDNEKVWLYEAYCKLDLGQGLRLYKFVFAENTLFDKQEVYCAPFKAFVPLPVPHVFLGNGFAHRIIPVQNARTVLTRAILDHTVTTNNPRWTVLQGGLLNPKEMLDNRKGGLVNIKRPDAIRALEQPNLNPFVFQTLEMLKANKEESTGISALSQGLNKEAISTQNSQGLVSDLVSLSQQRQKIVARNFADFLVDIYLEVYRLVLENEKQEKIVEIAGNYQPISVQNWIERTDCKVSVNLGYGDREKETTKFANTNTVLKTTAGRLYTEENQYNLIVDGLKSAGFKDHARYITSPQQLSPPEMDPVKKAELEIEKMRAEAALITAKATAQKVENTAAFDAIRAQMEEMRAMIEVADKTRTAERKDAEVQNRIEISNREMDLAENPPANIEGRSIISPN